MKLWLSVAISIWASPAVAAGPKKVDHAYAAGESVWFEAVPRAGGSGFDRKAIGRGCVVKQGNEERQVFWWFTRTATSSVETAPDLQEIPTAGPRTPGMLRFVARPQNGFPGSVLKTKCNDAGFDEYVAGVKALAAKQGGLVDVRVADATVCTGWDLQQTDFGTSYVFFNTSLSGLVLTTKFTGLKDQKRPPGGARNCYREEWSLVEALAEGSRDGVGSGPLAHPDALSPVGVEGLNVVAGPLEDAKAHMGAPGSSRRFRKDTEVFTYERVLAQP